MSRENKRREAVALRYDSEREGAPRVTAKGKGQTAENILQKARENSIPVQKDSSLTGLLSQLELNQTIPEDLYQAVAEVFAFIYKIDKEAKS
ncbi:EscU/YscU/HrcU family type III secretion system export apparatus switch protein [Peribacillus kribbensis]|uniref:EscU/YscU/HrcU family type III secretion system export apparatus switch protein n=1 Tax=Peribacillus kribbensis TaxID=356658 RepID=UPI000419E5AF|nr:EscU/YscU/HrcU family type III secretion system export apparatus switch protein [Peribacillus kribbensis]